ncbi:hypothetical protein B0I21_107236 [Sphingobacterium paludis]|uniref:Uncharacterized protein n=1 Tax=Sphingobacterium paludis TaxID=1476465 RepID=A0A4R7CXP9_9SPHI|nr:hypothetical protein B0I21_107236 [Sphingobacterium paludis]
MFNDVIANWVEVLLLYSDDIGLGLMPNQVASGFRK